MGYTVQQTPEVDAVMKAWNMTKQEASEVRFRLEEDLSENPAQHLHPVMNEPDYLEYGFFGVTSNNLYTFRVVYSRDRDSLVILECSRVPS